MTHAFKELRLTQSFINATGGVLRVGNEVVVYASQTGVLASSGNLVASGSALDTKINNLSGYSNTTFSTVSNLFTTGSNLDTKINNLSGYSNTTFSTVGNLFTTGSTLDTKINNLSGYSNNTFATITNLGSTGLTNFNRATQISGALDSRLGSTGLSLSNRIDALSGVNSVVGQTGAVTMTGAGNITVTASNGLITISGATGIFVASSSQQNFVTSIATGIDNVFISFTSNFPSVPKVHATVEVTGDIMYGANIRNRTLSGYTAIFSDVIGESGVVLHTFASL